LQNIYNLNLKKAVLFKLFIHQRLRKVSQVIFW